MLALQYAEIAIIFLTVVVLLAASLFFAFRCRTTLTLNWPKKIGFYDFKSRTKYFLKKNGWICEIWNFEYFPIEAKKGNGTVAIVCLPRNAPITDNKLKDLDAFQQRLVNRAVVFLTSEPIPGDIRAAVVSRSVNLLYYKELKPFAALESGSKKEVKAFFDERQNGLMLAQL